MSVSTRFVHSTRNGGITRVECTLGEMKGWTWVFSTPQVALHEMGVMIAAERTSPEGWFAAYSPTGRKMTPPPPLSGEASN